MSDRIDELLEGLGDDVARAQDRALASRPVPPRVAPKTTSSLGFVVVSVAAAVALLAFVVWPADPVITFEVDGSPGETGSWSEGRALTFSDGSRIELEPSTAARVMGVSAEGASLSLERGTANVRVVHRDADTRWSVAAGPFLVRVIGTAFTVRWEPDERVLRLHTEEGVVELTGPVLPEATRVRAGQSVTVDLSEQRAEVREGVERDEAIDPRELEPADSEEAETATEEIEPEVLAAREPVRVRPRAAPDWQALAAEARHADAVTAIDRVGLRRVLDRSNAAEMLLVGDTLRAAQDARAPDVYRRLRSQFPSTRPAARAAFMLGRMLQSRDPAGAAEHYAACLREDPGPLRREAHGRWVEALSAAHDPSARDVARRYLAAYPDGPHAPFAASLLN